MEKWFIVVTSSFMVGFVLSRINLYIAINIRRYGKDDNINIRVSMLGDFVNYNIKIPVIEFSSKDGLTLLESVIDTTKERIETHPKREKRFIKNLVKIYLTQPRRLRKLIKTARNYSRRYRKFMAQLFVNIYCEKLYWKTTFGSEDAALTGLGSGLLWSMKGLIVAILHNRIKVACRPEINVVPVFGRTHFEIDFSCIFRIRLGNVITATVSLFNTKDKGAVKSG